MKISNHHTVSIVLPTYNRLGRLKQVVSALENQTYRRDNFDVVVIADGCIDGTVAYLQTLKTPLRLTYIASENQGVAAARNRGIQEATGEYIVFIDDDVVPAPHLLDEHMRIHEENPGEVVVLGPMLTPPDFRMRPWVRWEQAMLVKQYHDMQTGRWQPTARQFYTGNASLARRHLVSAGGFDETFRRAEDVELAYRLEEQGLRFIFNPDAVGYHYAERSFHSWIEIPYAYGRNDVIFTRDRGQHWLLPVIMRELHERNAVIKFLVRLCVGRHALSRGARIWLRLLSLLGQYLGHERLAQISYSGLFNLRYYEGVTDELGSREQFLARLAQTQAHTKKKRFAR
jgi:GT2 family glycosyltransferase